MNDPWMDRLSDYIDGELADAERDALERHLAACDACTATVAELRAVLAAAHAAPDTMPETDLWPGISRRIEESDVVPIRARARRFSFSLPQLAAAAVVLMALSGGTVYLLQQPTAPAGRSGSIVFTAGGDGSVRLASDEPVPTDPAVAEDLAALERTLAQSRAQLDPATVEVVERSMESIDGAIAAARAALDADPGNPYLHRQLDNTMRKKLDLLRRATRTQRLGT